MGFLWPQVGRGLSSSSMVQVRVFVPMLAVAVFAPSLASTEA